jgi:ribosomal protein S15P/S13E
MKKHQAIHSKIKELLKNHFGSDLKEDGKHLTIGETGIWISCDDRELTVGYGLVHQHFDPEYDDIQNAIDRFFNLLTKRKRITRYYKGNFSYKNKTELILNDSEFENLGTAMTWLFPYWKRMKKEVQYEENLIDPLTIEKEVNEIKNYAQHSI